MPATGAVDGGTILLSVRTATAPDVYTTVGGQRGAKVSRSRNTLDFSAKGDGDEFHGGGRRSSTVSLDGLVIVNDAARAALIAAYEGNGAGRIRRGAIGAEAARQADVIITSIDEEFPDDAESTWSVELMVTGPWGPTV